MCLAIPAKIIEIKDEIGTIDMDGVKRKASLILLEDPQIGEYIIVHAGFGINKIDETAAEESLKILRQIAAMVDEASSLDHS
jgi:hydrogenase expression/formation protein HypC